MFSDELLTLAAYGIGLAMLVRWVFNLDVGVVFTALVGVLSVLATPWVNTMVGVASLSAMHGTVIGAFLASIVLGITQLLRSY